MELSLAQASLVEENMGLIGFVLKKINASYVRSIPSVDYEDLYQFRCSRTLPGSTEI